MFDRFKQRVLGRDASKRSLVKRSHFLTTIALVQLLLGFDFLRHGRLVLGDRIVFAFVPVPAWWLGWLLVVAGVFACVAVFVDRARVSSAAFMVASIPFTVLTMLHFGAFVLGAPLVCLVTALFYGLLLRLVWVSVAVVDLPDKPRTCEIEVV